MGEQAKLARFSRRIYVILPGDLDEPQTLERELPMRSQQASSAVELALILPFLLFLLLGMADIGIGMRTYGGLLNAAQAGARWLTTHPADVNGAVARITAAAETVDVSAAALTITLLPAQGSYQIGDRVTVRVHHEYPTLFGAFTAIPTIPLTVDVTMQVIYE